MGTDVIRVSCGDTLDDAVARARRVLDSNGLVVFPTETVYGVAVRADRPEAIARLHDAKRGDAGRPFTFHLPTPAAVTDYVPSITGVEARLVRKGWPGPLTLVLRMKPAGSPLEELFGSEWASALSADGFVGLRCPDHEVASKLLGSTSGPVVASSANRAGDQPPRSVEELADEFAQDVDLIVDAGVTRYSKASTVIRVDDGRMEVLREGVIDQAMASRLAQLRLLFVCTGNTCRSPMAEVLAKRVLAERMQCDIGQLGERGVFCESAGVFAGCEPAADAAIAVMKARGLDLSQHRSQPLSEDLIRQADHVFAMTHSHYDAIVDMMPLAADRVSMLMGNEDLTDPFGGSEETYEQCAREIECGLTQRIEEVTL